MLDDAERTGKAYFSIRDFKVYVLRLIVATDSAEFFKEEGNSNSEDKMLLADEISTVKTELANAVAHNNELRGEKLEQVIILDAGSLERLGGLQLRLAGYAIAELAKQALTYVLGRSRQPFLDGRARQKNGNGLSYQLVK